MALTLALTYDDLSVSITSRALVVSSQLHPGFNTQCELLNEILVYNAADVVVAAYVHILSITQSCF